MCKAYCDVPQFCSVCGRRRMDCCQFDWLLKEGAKKPRTIFDYCEYCGQHKFKGTLCGCRYLHFLREAGRL